MEGSENVKGLAIVDRNRVRVLMSFPVVASQAESPPDLAAAAGCASTPPDKPDPDRAEHADDFSWVNWYGRVYTFRDERQQQAIGVLWSAWKDDGWAFEQAILDIVGTDASRLYDLFRTSQAWGTMIKSAVPGGGPAGAFLLKAPAWAKDKSAA
jgi:hypothetical protein